MPFLVLAGAFEGMVSFVAVIYIVKKKSVNSLICAGIGAAVNLILNFILIKTMGAMGAAIATMVSYIAVFFVTTYISRELVQYRVKLPLLALNCGLVLLQSILTVLEVKYYLIFSAVIAAAVIVINFKSVYGTVRDLLARRGKARQISDENKTEAAENE
jgi:O-antigen/teichoic acid export membrane protein